MNLKFVKIWFTRQTNVLVEERKKKREREKEKFQRGYILDQKFSP